MLEEAETNFRKERTPPYRREGAWIATMNAQMYL